MMIVTIFTVKTANTCELDVFHIFSFCWYLILNHMQFFIKPQKKEVIESSLCQIKIGCKLIHFSGCHRWHRHKSLDQLRQTLNEIWNDDYNLDLIDFFLLHFSRFVLFNFFYLLKHFPFLLFTDCSPHKRFSRRWRSKWLYKWILEHK